MNTPELTPWKTVRLVVALVVQTTATGLLLLTGPKRRSILAGLMAPIGGHVEDGEELFTACVREMGEESGYRLNVPPEQVSESVAYVSVTIDAIRTTFDIRAYLIPFESVTGEFAPDLDEYEELSFKSFEGISAHLIPPGDEEWVPQAMNGRKGARVFIECGTDRRDLRRVIVNGLEMRRVTPA